MTDINVNDTDALYESVVELVHREMLSPADFALLGRRASLVARRLGLTRDEVLELAADES